MGAQHIAAIAASLGVGSWVPWAWRRIWRSPRDEAETRKANAEADDLIYERLSAEIERLDRANERLDRALSEVRKQLDQERTDCDKRMASMQGRIRQLEQEQVSRGNFSSNAADGPLRSVYQPDHSDCDDDLIDELRQVPGSRSGKRK